MPERLSPRSTLRLGLRPGGGRADARRYVKRALLFGAGLILLWVALQLLPSASPETARMYADGSGVVAEQSDDAAAVPGPTFPLGQLLALLVLSGGVALAVYLHRRNRRGEDPGPIRSLGSHSVGPGQSLSLVECGGDVLLIGIASGHISLLRTYPADAFPPAESAGAEGRPAPGSHFADVLRRYARPVDSKGAVVSNRNVESNWTVESNRTGHSNGTAHGR